MRTKLYKIVFFVLILVNLVGLKDYPVIAATKAPSKVVITYIKAKQNSIVLKYKKAKGAKKYQIAYKLSNNHKWTKKNTKKLSFTINKLKYNSKYQIRVRAYKKKWGKWSKTKTIKTPPKAVQPSNESNTPVKLISLHSTQTTPRSTTRLADNYGQKYSDAIINNQGYSGSSGPLTYEYLLGAKYSRITGTLYIPSGESSSGYSALTIIGDGRVLYTSPLMNKTSNPVKININITGINSLVVEWSNNSGYSNISNLNCCLAQARVYSTSGNNSNVNIRLLPVRMIDLNSIYSKPAKTNRLVDNYGNSYNTAVYNRVDNSHGNRCPIYEYLLNYRFSRFEGTLYVPQKASFSSSVSLIVTGDGNQIYRSPEFTAVSPPLHFSINVAGYNDLQITYTAQDWYGGNSEKTLCIANPYFYQ